MAAHLYVGIRGGVLALDRGTGPPLWNVKLKGGDFVTVHVDGDRVFAATKGEVFCLDAATGHEVWHNGLPGLGTGLVSLATEGGRAAPAEREKKRRDDAAAQSAAIAASS